MTKIKFSGSFIKEKLPFIKEKCHFIRKITKKFRIFPVKDLRKGPPAGN